MPTSRALHLLDSIALITPEMAEGVVVTGSHGGTSAASFILALPHKPHAVFFNDAGIAPQQTVSDVVKRFTHREHGPRQISS